MRSSIVILLLAVALSLAAIAPVASADANITLYTDAGCTNLDYGPIDVPLLSSPDCGTYSNPITGSISYVFICEPAAGLTNMSVQVWLDQDDCTGSPSLTAISYAKTDSCALVNITANDGTSYVAYGDIQCSISQEWDDVQETQLLEYAAPTAEQIDESMQTLQQAALKLGRPRRVSRTDGRGARLTSLLNM